MEVSLAKGSRVVIPVYTPQITANRISLPQEKERPPKSFFICVPPKLEKGGAAAPAAEQYSTVSLCGKAGRGEGARVTPI